MKRGNEKKMTELGRRRRRRRSMELEMGIRRQFVCEKRTKGDLRASCEGREKWEWKDEYPLRR